MFGRGPSFPRECVCGVSFTDAVYLAAHVVSGVCLSK
jgi:hypothetical protein